MEYLDFEYSGSDGGYVVTGLISEEVSDVIIPEVHEGRPVVGIGKLAFGGSDIKSVWLPGSVERIGDRAFASCLSLREVYGADGLRKIGDGAFRGCVSLSRFTVGEEVESIGDGAFLGCQSLIEVRNLSSLDIFPGSGAYGGVASFAENVYKDWDGYGEFFSDGDGFRFYRFGDGGSKKTILIGYDGEDTSIRLPEEHGEAFYDVGRYAFAGNDALESVEIPFGIKRVGECAFRGCTSLKRVHIRDLYAWFFISFEDVYANPLYEGRGLLFLDGAPLKCLRIPEGIVHVEPFALAGSAVEDISVPGTVRYFGYGAFSECVHIHSVCIDDLASWCAVEFDDYDACPLTHTDILLVGGKPAYDLVIPEGVVNIGMYAFCRCKAIYRVTLPVSLEAIGTSAFMNCDHLLEIRNLSSLKLKRGDKRNGSVAHFAMDIYSDDREPRFFVDGNGFAFRDDGGGLTLLGYTGDEHSLTFPVTEGRTYWVADHAFCECMYLDSVSVPGCVASIGDYAFSRCGSLRRLETAGVAEIGDHAFSGCVSLTELALGEGLRMLANDAFEYCGVKYVRLPDGLEEIGDYAFSHDMALEKVVVPGSVAYVGNYAFVPFATAGTKHKNADIYFMGSVEEWASLECGRPIRNKGLSHVIVYSESEPDDPDRLWHFDENGNPVRW